MSDNGYYLGPWPDGITLFPHSLPTERVLRAYEQEKCNCIALNWNLGYDNTDLEFLKDARGLRGLSIIQDHLSENLSKTACNELKLLRVDGISDKFDFHNSPLLELCSIKLESRFRSLETTRHLKQAKFNSYRYPDLTAISKNSELDELEVLAQNLVSLKGIEQLDQLRMLSICYTRGPLDLSMISFASNLAELELHSCKNIESLHSLSMCSQLRGLQFYNCGNLESLNFALELPRLESLYIGGSTRVTSGAVKLLKELQGRVSVFVRHKPNYDVDESLNWGNVTRRELSKYSDYWRSFSLLEHLPVVK